MAYVPPAQRMQQTAIALLNAPPPYDANPIFAQIPAHAWAQRGYQYTLTVQWSNVPVPGLAPITIRVHVHYAWDANAAQWQKIAGNAWIVGMDDWATPTTAAVVAMTPALPTDPNYHP